MALIFTIEMIERLIKKLYLYGCAMNRRSTPVGAEVKILLWLQAALLGEAKASFVATDAHFASAL